MSKVAFTIDGCHIEAEEGQNLLQAALDAGIYIPHLCYHPDLTPLGNCKLCTAEVDGTVVQSCEKIIESGMVVDTKSEGAQKLRMTALELILASHPKDCTSCDKYLNCELQALMQYMGVAHSRLREIEKETTRIQQSDALIKKEMQRCIQCQRCIRVCEEVRGVGALVMNKKDGETYVGTLDDKPLVETDCRFCGACVEVCPTGAIQDVKGIFKPEGPRDMTLVPCKNDCPAHTDIPLYVKLTEQERYSDAVSVIREKLTFPHSLGHICSHACESACKRNHLNQAINIRDIKKFAVEHDQDQTWRQGLTRHPANGKSVAVIGGGAAGMTGAYHLAKKGYRVDVYERQAKAGGMLTYGIPKYRLPQTVVDNELEILMEEGIHLHTGSEIRCLEDLADKAYDATLLAMGANRGKRPPAFRGQWDNAINAVDFCRQAIEDKLPDLGDTVTVYGGGNVGFDCARTAKKLGVKTVRVICMEKREDMLADLEEVEAGLSEGLEIHNARAIRAIKEADGRVTGLDTISINDFSFTGKGLELDQVEGSEETLTTDTLIFATGQETDLTPDFGIDLVKRSFAQVSKNMMTSTEGVFAAGDTVYGTKSIVEAIASGKKAAEQMDAYLGGDGHVEDVLFQRQAWEANIGSIEDFGKLERMDCLKDCKQASYEASRCLQCNLRTDIRKVKYWVDPHFKTIKEVRK